MPLGISGRMAVIVVLVFIGGVSKDRSADDVNLFD
jgi:hypothetical protein